MDKLEQVWEVVSGLGSGFMRRFERSLTSLFGSANARYLKRLTPRVAAINELEPKYEALSDEQLRAQTDEFRRRLAAGETLDDILVEAFAVCREAGRRFLGMRHYDVQLIGGMILHGGNIAEMVTGEGKTLVATLPAYLNALEGQGVHVVTVNDYLARRDMEWMGPLYLNLGLSVGAIQSGMPQSERQRAYACDITYGTNNEFGFDYLRDNMRLAARGDDTYPKHEQQAQGPLNYAIVDEVDNILIDEARTPLIISGPAEDDVTKYSRADKIARQLKRDVHFEIKEKEHSAHLTDAGIREAEKLADVESFYTAGNMEWPHLIDNSLKAHHLYKRDVNYVVQNGEVIIVDEFTGRLMPGRQWSDGLHQAVEAKEGVRIKEESQTLATITLQNLFKLYRKIAGMTGTAMTEAGEFWKIYKLDVIAVPTNKPLRRLEYPDSIYRTEREKFVAIANEIEQINKWDVLELSGGEIVRGSIKNESNGQIEIAPEGGMQTRTYEKSKIANVDRSGRPILVGTVSIEKSERLADLLDKRGIKHEVLNAKHHKREAEIVAQAGRKGRVTIATNMAGRGTDIILGGNAETMAWAQLQDKYPTRLDVPDEEWNALIHEIEERENMKAESAEVKERGGLHIIGTERHEARRIDLQLRGRCGRQGDPGSSRFFLSLEDDLMRIFAGEWVRNVLTRLGMEEGQAIESKMVSRRIEGAQKKVEERNFEIRKNLLEYDEVMDEQRKRVYSYRQRILDGGNCRELIKKLIDHEIDKHLKTYLSPGYGPETFAIEAGKRLNVELDPRDFRGVEIDFAEQTAKDEAEQLAESQVLDAIDENLPEDEEGSEWNWEALAKFFNTRWNLNYRDRDLKRLGRDHLAEEVIEKAQAHVREISLRDLERYLDPQYGPTSACEWFKAKFGIEMNLEEIAELEAPAIVKLAKEKAAVAYERREDEYPVLAGLHHFATRAASGARYDRESLVEWAREQFDADISLDDIRNKQREEVREFLVQCSRKNNERTQAALVEGHQLVESIFTGSSPAQTATEAAQNGKLESLSEWLKNTTDVELSPEEIGKLDRQQLDERVEMAVELHFRPQMRRMERALLLQVLDGAWKDHLLTMDHLRAGIGLVGYAQVDPKVEYKREGMKLFDGMWDSVGEIVTNLIFRMEQLDDSFVRSTWVESEAIHEDHGSELARQQNAIDNAGAEDRKIEPIRNRGQKVGRNDPCPCGSGKKYKQCCMKKGRGQSAA